MASAGGTKKARRPKLRHDVTVVEARGKRWKQLIDYVRQLNLNFPREDLTTLCGFFSTEAEFARHIERIEKRIKTAKA